jgi:hypothetical protein
MAESTGRLSQHASSSSGPSVSTYVSRQHSSYHPYQAGRGSAYRGGSVGRGRGYSRGRGGHVSTHLDLRGVNRAAARTSRAPSATEKLISVAAVGTTATKASGTELPASADTSGKEKEDGEVSRSPSPARPTVKAPPPPVSTRGSNKAPGWVKSSRGNSLMTADKQ